MNALAVGNILEGQKVRLTALAQDDLPTVARWYEDSSFLRMLDARAAQPRTENELQGWLSSAHKARDGFLLAIRRRHDGQLIGYLEIDGILWNQQTGFIGIGIGEQSDWGHGYGREAMELALGFAFDELNLHRISLNVFSYNTRAIALYESLGFKQEGVQREALFRGGQRHDLIWYGLLRREWEAQQGEHKKS